MRNPDRMEPLLEKLLEAWQMVPDWRLGQFIYNMVGRDPFYMEDDKMLESIKKFIEENKKEGI